MHCWQSVRKPCSDTPSYTVRPVCEWFMRSLLSCRAWKQWDGQTDGQIVAAAQTKLHIPMEPGRKWGSTCHTEPPGNSLNTLALTSPGCRSRMPTVSTPHAIGINDFQKAEEQKDAKNVNTAQRADHTAGRRGEKGLPSLCEDFFFFSSWWFGFSGPPAGEIRPGQAGRLLSQRQPDVSY